MARQRFSLFDEVQMACADMADDLKLTGPAEDYVVAPTFTYRGVGVEYQFLVDGREGTVGCTVEVPTETANLTVGLEALAIAAGVVEKRGGISYSARNQNQFRKSLQGQVDYIRRVHPFLTDPTTAEPLMRRADAREWLLPQSQSEE
ncbi:hypothetical protein OG885_30910 [Streptomyces sp. NBC_00028]|uniref:hypothetical protein n=1 Tax=Streptomyces sp. NBC_00028 TaxID=2975624 RepID=UPI00325620C5